MAIHITGDDAADQILTDNPFALLVGMMLDQQYPMEHAFRGPSKVVERFGTFSPADIAAADPGGVRRALLDASGRAPVPGVDGRPDAGAGPDRRGGVRRPRRATVDGSRGRPGANRRLLALPGFGKQKARIFVALLAKQLGVRPDGWELVPVTTRRMGTGRWRT